MIEDLKEKGKEFFEKIKERIPEITERELIALWSKLLIENKIFKDYKKLAEETIKSMGDQADFTIEGQIKLYELLDNWMQAKEILEIIEGELNKLWESKHYIGKEKS